MLIVGGGPIGLALAADLGRRGVGTLLVEKRENKLQPVKMLEVSVRIMEFCRQLGVIEKVRNWGFPSDRPLDSVFVTSMRGYEIGSMRTPRLWSKPIFQLAQSAECHAPKPGSTRSFRSARGRFNPYRYVIA